MSTATIGEIRVRCEIGGETLHLLPGSELGAGGQATVYPVPGRDDRVAKIYHDPVAEQARRLHLMLARRPAGATSGAGGGVFAWPLDLLRDGERRCVGLLLPRVDGKLRLFELYNPATRRDRAPLFHHGLLHRAARNLAAAFHVLHEAGFVVGDVNESNVLVGEDGRVTLIDTDSFQVRDPVSGVVFRCPVGRPEFTPPELRERRFAEVDRAPEHDRFGLGVLVFQVLMEGTHPFAGRWRSEGEPPPVEARIAAGHFPYAGLPGVPLEPARTAPPLEVLDPGLRALLARCFVDGHRDPAARPDAAEWRDALAAAEGALAACERNEQHRFGGHLDACPWCERARRLEGRDPFPSARAVELGEHRRPAVRARAPRRHRPEIAPRPRFRAVARAGSWPLPAPFPGALFGLAFLISLVGLASLAIPPLLVAITAGGLLVMGRSMTSGGAFRQWASALTVLLVMLGFGAGSPSSGAREIGPPEPYLELPPVRGPGAGVPSAAFSYAPEALDRLPVLEDTAALLAAVASLTFPDAPGEEEPELLLRFVVDTWGQVVLETVTLTPDPGSYTLGVFRGWLEPVRFHPGEYDGRAVPTEVLLPLRRVGGRMVPDLAAGSWNPGQEDPSPRVDRSGAAGPVNVADADVEPLLLNAKEVQSALGELYPPHLRDAGITGVAQMKFVIAAEGHVVPSSIVAVSTTHEEFAGASAAAVAKMLFGPAVVEGRAVPVLVRMPVRWTLERS